MFNIKTTYRIYDIALNHTDPTDRKRAGILIS